MFKMTVWEQYKPMGQTAVLKIWGHNCHFTYFTTFTLYSHQLNTLLILLSFILRLKALERKIIILSQWREYDGNFQQKPHQDWWKKAAKWSNLRQRDQQGALRDQLALGRFLHCRARAQFRGVATLSPQQSYAIKNQHPKPSTWGIGT